MTAVDGDIRLELDRGVAELVLDRPAKHNAVTPEMARTLQALARQLDADDEVRAVLLRGEGERAFCSGSDLNSLAAYPSAWHFRNRVEYAHVVRSIRKPVVAALKGWTLGGGAELALAADIRIAAPAARFNAAFIKIGLTGGDCGSSWLLPRIVGLGHAYEILLTGRLVEADEAARIGLVNRVVPSEELLTAALEVAELIAANSPLGVRLTKQMVQVNVDAPSLEAAVELENRNQALAAGTEDMVEAFTAFREKRPPVFTGL